MPPRQRWGDIINLVNLMGSNSNQFMLELQKINELSHIFKYYFENIADYQSLKNLKTNI